MQELPDLYAVFKEKDGELKLSFTTEHKFLADDFSKKTDHHVAVYKKVSEFKGTERDSAK